MTNTYRQAAKNIRRHTIELIKNVRKSYGGVCLVMAPIFNSENITEGYIQRVKAIDDEILNNTFNIYVDFETKNTLPTITQVDNRHLLLSFMPHCKYCVKELIKIAKCCDLLYTHSVMRAMANIVGEHIHTLYKTKSIFKIWDVHGSVPEEFALSDNYFEAQNAGDAEELFVNCADIIICVNDAMKAHLQKKYCKSIDNAVILPIFNTLNSDFEKILQQKSSFPAPIAVYAGGLQDWQNIPLMQDTIKKAGDKYQYKIFVSDTVLFENLWGTSPYPQSIEIGYKPSNEVFAHYKLCHYGFVLRDDIVVNNVACPTKLIEYLQYGIVPILKTDRIGDFANLGMKYIYYQDFITSVPDNSEYLTLARHNFNILQDLLKTHDNGKKLLQDILYEKFNF